jgi:competence protein ComEC
VRLFVLLVVIAIYVPVAGAGPSIQRAGVMGAAAVVAALAGRPASRLYALLAAAAITLALDPRACADPGWQLSFAAVAGIALGTRALRRLLGAGPTPNVSSPVRAAALDGAAVTLAATLATAPLMAHHFGAVSIASIPANLVALPAIAPVMWLGMLSAAVGQVPAIPVEPLTWLAGVLAAYVTQVADWFAAPSWAAVPVELGSPLSVLAAYLGLGLAVALLDARRRRRRELRPRRVAVLAATIALTVPLLALAPGGAPERRADNPGLLAVFLDVGQGDAILLDPEPGEPVLVDGGPPGAGLPARLRELGVERLAAVLATHDELDHAGGLAEVLGIVPVRRFLYARAGAELRGDAKAAGVRATRVAEGSVISSDELELRVLWPPRRLLEGPGPEDANAHSVVAVASWRRFDLLLTGDGEAELAPIEPGAVEALKVAHHGSADAGLGALLERADPDLALISAGEGNPYGHPAPETISQLGAAAIPVLRTDRDGEITIEADEGGWNARSDR